MPAIPLTKSF